MKTGVIWACFNQDANFAVLKGSLKAGWRKSANKSSVSKKLFVGISCSCVVLAKFKFLISFNISYLAIGLKLKERSGNVSLVVVTLNYSIS